MDKDNNKNEIIPLNQPQGEFLIYSSPDGDKKIQVRLIDETVWLSQKQMSELFQKDVRTINEHINNIFAENELQQDVSTVRDFRIVQKEGEREVSREVGFYSLDVIISVGYRVKSIVGTLFRQWATQRIKEYLVKGFTINKEYLKNPEGLDHFDELLEQIREIRASEKRFYQKIRDVFKLSVDYDADIQKTNTFYAAVQNKLLYAVTEKVAAQIITERSNPNAPNMNLTSWKGQRVRKQDVTIAKNYLEQDEIKTLDRMVTAFLDYIEDVVSRRQDLYMNDWLKRTNKFLEFYEYEILEGTGGYSKKDADKLVQQRYDEFDKKRKEQEALEADEEDIKELKELEVEMEKIQKLEDKQRGKRHK